MAGSAVLLVTLTSLAAVAGAPGHPLSAPPAISPSHAGSLTSAALALGGGPAKVKGSLKWTQLSPTRAPSPRTGFMMTYDRADHEVVLFGGTPRFLWDTWTFVHGAWTNISPAKSPPARYGGVMTYDAKDGYVLLFGGNGPRGALNDTWSFSGGNWTNLTHGRSPSARFGASMAYDPPIGRVVLFGGCPFLPPLQELCPGKGGLSDTWTYRAGSWTDITGNRTHPHARYLAGLAYDPREKGLVLFGGNGASAFVGSTWELLGQKWHLMSKVAAPGPRGEFAMIYAARGTGNFVLFGGTTGEVPGSLYLGGTFVYGAGSWSALPLVGPSARAGAVMAEDTTDHVAVLFGGYDGSVATYYNQTWELT